MRTIEVYGKEYPVKELSGSFHMGAIVDLFSNKDNSLFDLQKQLKTGLAIRHSIPGLPETIIDETGQIKMLENDFFDLINQLRLLFCLDNLELAKQRQNYTSEMKYAKGMSIVKLDIETSNINRKEQDEWEWDKLELIQTEDIELSEEDKDKRIFSYFLGYVESEIKRAEEHGNRDRYLQLKKILKDINKNRSGALLHHTRVQTEKEQTIEDLKKEIEQLKQEKANVG